MEPWVASHCDPGFELGGFLGNSKPHPRRIGHVYEQLAPGPANSIQEQRQPSPMLESLSLTARQRAMIDNKPTAFLSTELKNSDHRGRGFAADSRHA
jgi:hypothetical protein